MQPKLRQILQCLCDADLHVMTRNALVVRDGFVRYQRALGRISHRHDHTPRPFSIGRAQDVMGRLGLCEVWDRLHGDRRLRQQAEQLG